MTAWQADRLDHDLVADGAVLVLVKVFIAIASFLGQEVLVLEELALPFRHIVALLALQLFQLVLEHLLDARLEATVPHVDLILEFIRCLLLLVVWW